MKRGFTLVELLVVIAMLALLMGALSSSILQARRRANIERATVVCQELTNAILAYENYPSAVMPALDRAKADQSSIGFVTGNASDGDIPVLFNATFTGSARELLDPWGHPYYVTVKAVAMTDDDDLLQKMKGGMSAGVYFPNYWRRHAGER